MKQKAINNFITLKAHGCFEKLSDSNLFHQIYWAQESWNAFPIQSADSSDSEIGSALKLCINSKLHIYIISWRITGVHLIYF